MNEYILYFAFHGKNEFIIYLICINPREKMNIYVSMNPRNKNGWKYFICINPRKMNEKTYTIWINPQKMNERIYGLPRTRRTASIIIFWVSSAGNWSTFSDTSFTNNSLIQNFCFSSFSKRFLFDFVNFFLFILITLFFLKSPLHRPYLPHLLSVKSF